MQKILMAAFAATVGIGFATSSANAQLNQTWVASFGSGSTCSRAAPCADFATAISKTNANGQIGCVDSGEYPAQVTVNKAITIDCTGVHATIVTSTNGLLVAVPGGTTIVLRGLNIQGLSTGLGTGVFIQQGGLVRIEGCDIHGFAAGMLVAANNATSVSVTETSISENVTGIIVGPTGGPKVNVMIDRSHLDTNSIGIDVDGSSGATTRMQINNSTVSGNAIFGIRAQTGAQPMTVMVADSLVSANATGVTSSGAAAAVLLNGTTITNNSTALSVANNGAIFTYGNNAINDNGSPGTAPTPVALR